MNTGPTFRSLVSERGRQFRFPYGDYGDEAELSILVPPSWDGQVPPSVTMVALKGNWASVSKLPGSLLGKQMIRAAEKATGLKLAFSRTWVLDSNGNAIRAVVLSGGCVSRVHFLLPAFAEA